MNQFKIQLPITDLPLSLSPVWYLISFLIFIHGVTPEHLESNIGQGSKHLEVQFNQASSEAYAKFIQHT